MKYKTLTPVTGIDVGMQREWLIGQQLNTLKGEDGKLHGARCVECLLSESAPSCHSSCLVTWLDALAPAGTGTAFVLTEQQAACSSGLH